MVEPIDMVRISLLVSNEFFLTMLLYHIGRYISIQQFDTPPVASLYFWQGGLRRARLEERGERGTLGGNFLKEVPSKPPSRTFKQIYYECSD